MKRTLQALRLLALTSILLPLSAQETPPATPPATTSGETSSETSSEASAASSGEATSEAAAASSAPSESAAPSPTPKKPELIFDSDDLQLEGELAALKNEAAAGNAQAACQLARRYALNGKLRQADSWATRYIDMLAQQAEKGDTKAMLLLAALYWRGEEFVEQDAAQAARWLSMAADKGEASAAYLLGEQYKGQGQAEESQKAFARAYEIYRERYEADPNDLQSLYWLGYMEQMGLGVDQNVVSGIAKLEQAADQGSEWALTQLFKSYAEGLTVEKDTEKAMSYAARIVEQTQDATMAMLLASYHLNLNGTRDASAAPDKQNAEGLRYLDLAAAGNNAAAISTKSRLLAEAGQYADALPLLQQAASMGDLQAMTQAGSLLLNGADGIERDSEEALRYLRTAAERYGDPAAAAVLADYYLSAGEKDIANHWIVMASDGGAASAMLRRGFLHLSPFSGLDWNPTLTYQWWKQGAALGDSSCASALNIFHFVFIPLLLILVFGLPLYLNYRWRKKAEQESGGDAAAAPKD